MPTGYTSTLYEGEQAFEDFVLGCARAFGALITMRDDPAAAPIPEEFEPSSYHDKQIVDAQLRLRAAEAWTEKGAEQLAQADYEERLAAWKDSEQKRSEMRARYAGMLEQVERWMPPTEEHVGLKDFMAEQLRSSIKFDTDYRSEPPKRLTGKAFSGEQIAKALRDIEYHVEEAAKERERTEGRTRWVQELRQSLEGVPA